MPSKSGSLLRVAIVGASSLRGKELKQVLEDRNFPAGDTVLLDASVMAGTLTEAGGEPTFIRALDEDSFDGIRFAFFAGSVPDAEQNWLAAQRAGATVIDLTGALSAAGRGATSAVAWIPSLTSVLPLQSRPGASGSLSPLAYASPSVPVIVACTLAAGLARFQPQRIVVVFFPPVSEQDQPGIEELETQTASLLSFREIGKTVFDAQVAFNLLAGYGPESNLRLPEIRATIARDVRDYLAGRAPLPAIQLVQAPVFYGYSFAAYAEFGSAVAPDLLGAPFADLGVKFSAAGEPGPTNVSTAGESEIQLARIEPDPNIAGGIWIWGGADNLRLAATNAVRIAEELLAERTA